jgi:hypothetical protein
MLPAEQPRETPAEPLRREDEQAGSERLWRAVMLAPSLEVCRALLRGERVPLDHLDAEWLRRFGRRRGR